MLANFTANHEELTKAINGELPRLLTGVDRDYATDLSLMEEICTYLEQYPGRKNVFWFKSGSPLIMGLTPDPTTVAGYVDLRPLYDELEKARVALYPIDTRGLQLHALHRTGTADGGRGGCHRRTRDLQQQRSRRRHEADRGLGFELYTLTYSPQEVKLDNRWHNVKVEVDGVHYQLSYRRGYFDDGSNLKQAEGPGRKRLLQNGEAAPALHTEPIVLQVGLTPFDPAATKGHQPVLQVSTTPPRKGERRLSSALQRSDGRLHRTNR